VKALRWNDSLQDPQFCEEELRQPQPERGEVSIQVFAAGITPSELHWYPTSHRKNGEARGNAVPAHEFSGVIAAIGENAGGFQIDDEVYGMNDWFSDGALTEYCISRPDWIAPKPKNLSHEEAATVPIAALTAWQGLYERADLKSGERVLVQGGAGAVGLFAVQLAKLRGAHVVATVSERNIQFVKELGADEVLDYTKVRFEETVREMDVVFDAVGGETLRRSWSVLKSGGRMITIAADIEGSKDERDKKAFFIVEPNGEQLRKISDLLEEKRLRTVVDAVLPFSAASRAYAGKVAQGQGRGKSVVTVRAQRGTAVAP
jgi:NADPH:quinone reductase-like Zn-dependent oxidoreductase